MQSLEKQVKNRFNISDLITKLLRRVLKLEQSGGSGGGGITLPIGIPDVTNLQPSLNNKQDTLVSGINIKTVNSDTLLGSGNIDLIPITGTQTGKPLTGNIEVGTSSNIGLFKTTATATNLFRFIGDKIQLFCRKTTSILTDASILDMSQTQILLSNRGVSGFDKSELELTTARAILKNKSNNLILSDIGLEISMYAYTNGGVWSNPGQDYSNNAIPTSFMQKVYIDKQHSYFLTESLTGGSFLVGLNAEIYRIVFNIGNIVINIGTNTILNLDLTSYNINYLIENKLILKDFQNIFVDDMITKVDTNYTNLKNSYNYKMICK